ncbi:MAG: VOC family protein [Planctomycetaceae bacterium]
MDTRAGIETNIFGRLLQQEQMMRHLAAPIRVQNLDHVTLVVKDLEATRQFYLDLLGLEEVPRPNFSFPGAWFQAGDQQIHIIVENNDSGPAGQPRPEGRVGNRTHHFAFQVADTHEAGEILRERGHEIISGPKERPDGAVQVFVCDPDNYVVELCSLPKE